MPDFAYGKHRHPDHLPARRAERERRLLVQPRRLGEHLPRDRGDDRQDHDRQHDAGGEDRAAGHRGRAGEERQERQVLVEPVVDRDQVRRQRAGAPQAEDHRGHRGQQVDHVGDRHGQPAGRVVRDEQRDAERERHRQQQRQDRGQDRAVDQRPDVRQEVVVRRVGGLGLAEPGNSLDGEEDEHARERRQDRQAGDLRRTGEEAVAAAPGWLRRRLLRGGGDDGHGAPRCFWGTQRNASVRRTGKPVRRTPTSVDSGMVTSPRSGRRSWRPPAGGWSPAAPSRPGPRRSAGRPRRRCRTGSPSPGPRRSPSRRSGTR